VAHALTHGSEPAQPATEVDHALSVMDLVARQILAGTPHIRFGTARSVEERTAIYAMRYAVAVTKGWLAPGALPDGLERDDFDEDALHLVGLDGETLAASARLVFPSPGLALPTEEAFGLTIGPRGQVVDMGREIVAREYSNLRHEVFAGLLACAWLEVRARGFWRVCGVFSAPMLRLTRMMGMEIATLGPARSYWGEPRYPILFDVAASARVLTKRFHIDANRPHAA
jgi:N-acyl-L-homoserine lactone synthetase